MYTITPTKVQHLNKFPKGKIEKKISKSGNIEKPINQTPNITYKLITTPTTTLAFYVK